MFTVYVIEAGRETDLETFNSMRSAFDFMLELYEDYPPDALFGVRKA